MQEKKTALGVRIEFDLVSSRVVTGGNYEIAVVADSDDDKYIHAAMNSKTTIPLELTGSVDTRSIPVAVRFVFREIRGDFTYYTAVVVG